jgi:acetyltransferase-like isoleucine patch superfamily enzyme
MKIMLDKMSRIIQKIIMYIEGGESFSASIRRYYKKKCNISIGYGSYGWLNSEISNNISIGNYCSIATGSKIYNANHSIDYFTTHPLFYNPIYGYVVHDKLKREPKNIGHDVWIGANVIILAGCRNIGNRAVVGAGSVVTKDIPPYAIVAGNPARIIRMRFSDDIIQKLEESNWWMYKKEELIKRKLELEKIIKGI